MITRILLSCLLVFAYASAFAQCNTSSSSESSESSSESESRPWWRSDEESDEDSDDSGLHFGDGEGPNLPFRVGYGQYYSLANSRTLENVSGLEIDKSWLNAKPLNVFELWFRVGKNKKAAFGYTVSFRRLGKYESSTTVSPPADMTGDTLNPLTYDFEKKANTFGAGMFYEQSIIGQDDDIFRLTGRIDLGMTGYGYSASVTYRDTCGCLQTPVSVAENSKIVLTTRFGLGAELDFGRVGVKGLVGYEMQANNSFITKGQFDSWYGRFDQREYDYTGMPNKERFSIPGYSDAEKVRTRTGYLYVGFSVWVNLQREEL